MIHQHPATAAVKCHPSSFSQFLAMHHHHHHHHHTHQQQHARPGSPDAMLDDIESVGDGGGGGATTTTTTTIGPSPTIDATTFGANIGKSFTIAAILGLKKNAAAAAAVAAMEQHHHHQHALNSAPHHGHHGHLNAMHPGHSHALPFHPHLQTMSPSSATNQTAPGRDYSAVMNLSINNSAMALSNNIIINNNNNNNNNNNSSVNNKNHGNIATGVHPALRMPSALEKHLSMTHHHHNQHQQQQPPHAQTHKAQHHQHMQNASTALQSLQQLQQVHGAPGAGGLVNAFASRERGKSGDHHSSKKNSLKSKRVRTIFTPEQLERLESEFERQQYMVGPERLYLAHTLQLTEAQVKVWFQNRRIKWRKHHLEVTQLKLASIRHQSGAVGVPASLAATTAPECRVAEQHSPSSHPTVECDLSICTDSMDSNGSIHDDVDHCD